MNVDTSGHQITLSSGKSFYAHGGVIGLSELHGFVYGWDGQVDHGEDFTKEERKEIADHMIDIWEKFKEEYK